MDCSLPHSSACAIFEAKILKWGAIYYSRGSSRLRTWTQVSSSALAGGFFTISATCCGNKCTQDLSISHYEGLFSVHAPCPGAVGGSSAPCHLLAHRLKKQCLLQLFAEKKREWLSKVKLLIKVLLKWNTFISNCVGWSKSHGHSLGAGQ